jgi:serine/threonine protein kinase
MNQKRKVIGEGAYGCVHKPSIHCKTGVPHGFDYSKYVSKIMQTKEAESELKEFIVIGSYDKENEFHLGAPRMCQPNLDDPSLYEDISECKHIKASDVKKKPKDYKLLLLEYGGPDLKALCNNELNKYLKTNKSQKSDAFWLEVHRLIKGLQFFKKNGIVHNDIKPQNILFNTKTGELKYIDFGLMRKKDVIVHASKKNDNFLGIFHWSYPFDCGFMEKKMYQKYLSSTKIKREAYKRQLSNLIVINSDKKTNILQLPIRHPDAFNILFAYINPEGVEPVSAKKYGYIQHFFDGFNELIDNNTYATVLDKITDSIDVFGLGFTLQYILNCFMRQKAVSNDMFARLSSFFHKMYDFNPNTRETNIDVLLNEYETILLETGILLRLKKDFVDNTITNRPPVSKTTLSHMMREDRASKSKSLSASLEHIANLDPGINAFAIKSKSKDNRKSKSKSIKIKGKNKTRKRR